MLKDLSHEEYLVKYNKFPKTKYSLYLDGKIYYEFTTTSRGENECISILKEMTSPLVYVNKKTYTIFSTVNGEKRLIFKGRTKSYYDI